MTAQPNPERRVRKGGCSMLLMKTEMSTKRKPSREQVFIMLWTIIRDSAQAQRGYHDVEAMSVNTRLRQIPSEQSSNGVG